MTVKLNSNELNDYASILLNLESGRQGRISLKDIEKIKEISVDARGYSREVSENLGKQYIEDNIIIVSPEQKYASIDFQEYSFLPSILEDAHKLKNDFSFSIWGEIKIKKAKIGFDVTTKFDTPAGNITKIRNLRDRIELLNDNLKSILDDEYMNALLEEAGKLNDLYGSIMNIDIGSFQIKKNVFSFKYPFLSTYFLNNGDPIAILCDSSWLPKKIEGVETVRKECAIDKLLERGYAEPDFPAVREEMRKIEDPIIEKIKYEELKKDSVNTQFFDTPYYELKGMEGKEASEFLKPSLFERFKILSSAEVANSLPQSWYSLNSLLLKKGKDSDYELKKKFLKAAASDMILEELVCKLKE